MYNLLSDRKDIMSIADCHILTFPNSFSSKLGKKYCVKMFDWYLTTDNAFLIHIEDERRACVGYCGGIINNGKLNAGSSTSIIQHTFWIALSSICLKPWLLFNLELLASYKLIIKNLVIKVNKILRFKERGKSSNFKHHVGLVVIGVNPKYQSKGFGSKLLKEFERKVIDFGYNEMRLVVSLENKIAQTAYKNNGWKLVSSFSNKIIMSKSEIQIIK